MKAKRRLVLIAVASVSVAALGIAAVRHGDFVLCNRTPSMAVGLYMRAATPIERGAVVTVRAVDVSPDYAALHNFTDPGDRFLKRVVGMTGDVACASAVEVTLNGALVAERQARDSAGRALPTWSGCVTLDEAHVFLLGETADSFDGRYWGPTPIDRIEGVWRRIGS